MSTKIKPVVHQVDVNARIAETRYATGIANTYLKITTVRIGKELCSGTGRFTLEGDPTINAVTDYFIQERVSSYVDDPSPVPFSSVVALRYSGKRLKEAHANYLEKVEAQLPALLEWASRA